MSQIEDLRQRENRTGGLAAVSMATDRIDAEIATFKAQLLLDYQNASDTQLAQMPPLPQALADLDRYAQNQRSGIDQPATYDRFYHLAPLPEILIADYIVTGAIVAHDSDVISGGTGLRFQNIGVLQQVHKHVITVSLRLVRVSDGEIVANKTASQTVLSKRQQGDILNYVTLNQILEFESGYVTNEPRSMALDAAFRLALSDMMIEMQDRW